MIIIIAIPVFFQFQRQLSDKNQVTLENLNLNSAGQYRCEISAEAPLFNTVAQSKKLNVIGKEVFLQFLFIENCNVFFWRNNNFIALLIFVGIAPFRQKYLRVKSLG